MSARPQAAQIRQLLAWGCDSLDRRRVKATPQLPVSAFFAVSLATSTTSL